MVGDSTTNGKLSENLQVAYMLVVQSSGENLQNFQSQSHPIPIENSKYESQSHPSPIPSPMALSSQTK